MTPLKKILLLLFIPLMAFTMHKYYLSLTRVVYNSKEQSIHITMRLFIDDLEKSLNNNFKKEFKLDTPKELVKTNDFIGFYLNNNFSITINDTLKNYTFLGKEYENDIVYFYIEIDSVSQINNISIQNTILMKEFDTQQNIIKLEINDQKKTMILNKSNDKDLLKF